MCDKIARIVPIRQIDGLPTVPVSSDPRNGDWIETDIFIGEFAMDVNTGLVYTRSPIGIIGVSAGTGDFIPLSGTEVGSPVTGDIEFQEYVNIANLYLKDGSLIGGIRFYAGGAISIFHKDTDTNYESSISPIQNGLVVGVTGDAPFGIIGYNYYASNYDENTYVQKKYVDSAMITIDYGDIENAGGIENAQVFTTGTGTGIAIVNLSSTIAIGKDVTVSDLGNNASTHNIQIDAGVGNTILYNGVATQVITLTTDGASVTIRKITANQFMVIAKN